MGEDFLKWKVEGDSGFPTNDSLEQARFLVFDIHGSLSNVDVTTEIASSLEEKNKNIYPRFPSFFK